MRWLPVVRATCALWLHVLWICATASAQSAAVESPAASATANDRIAGDFVRVESGQFWLQDAPFRFVGANVSVIHGANERLYADAVLDAAKADGLSVVRIWALGEQPSPGQSHHPLYAFRIGADGWVQESFVQLDRVLAAARARGLRVILVLANRWKDYGGIGTYVDWAGGNMARDLRGQPQATQLSGFFGCGPCDVLYRQHVERVVGRVNSLSGIAYRDDPTIFAWELINEASAVTARDEETLLAWARNHARYIRRLDARHLISAGHIGYGSEREREVWRLVQALPEIDFADAHAYPLKDPRVTTPARLKRWIDDRLTVAYALKKPLIFGEFGFERALKHRRSRWTALFLDHAASRGVAGALIWNYQPAKSPPSAHSISEDPHDRDSLRMRRVLERASVAFRAPPPRRPPSARFTYTQTLRVQAQPHRAWVSDEGVDVLDIDPLRFSRASFERAGTYEEAVLDLVYGSGAGFIEYRFEAARKVPKAVIIEARISSELPGYGLGDDPRDGSDVEIQLDGQTLATVRAKPDDGLGELMRVRWDDAPSLRKMFGRGTRHHLRFVALPSRHAGGLCVYGKPTGVIPLDPAWKRELDQVRIQLVR